MPLSEAEVHERAFVKAFAAPNRRERYLGLLSTSKGRRKFVAGLHHNLDLDSRYAERLDAGHNREEIEAIITRALGADSECWLISDYPELDGKRLLLGEALRAISGYGGGTIISCVAGKSAYYEGEDRGARLICRRK